MVQYSFTSTETRRLVRTDSPGRPPGLSQLLNYAICLLLCTVSTCISVPYIYLYFCTVYLLVFIYLVLLAYLARVSIGDSRSLLLCLCDVFRAVINSLVSGFIIMDLQHHHYHHKRHHLYHHHPLDHHKRGC